MKEDVKNVIFRNSGITDCRRGETGAVCLLVIPEGKEKSEVPRNALQSLIITGNGGTA